MVMGPWQPSLPLPLWSNPALSAHYRHHPVHYHRCVAPVQHYRQPNYCIWSLKKIVSVLCLKVDCRYPLCLITIITDMLCVRTSWRFFFFNIYIWPLFPSTHKSNDVAVYYYLTTLGWSPSNPTFKHPFCCLSTFGVYVTEMWLGFFWGVFFTIICQTMMAAYANAFNSW